MVIYTGTHDNDTTLGWYGSLEAEAAAGVRKYLGLEEGVRLGDFCWRLIERAYSDAACIAIVPVQDVLCLGGEDRMNLPGTVGGGNWQWRLRQGALTPEIAARLAELVVKYQR